MEINFLGHRLKIQRPIVFIKSTNELSLFLPMIPKIEDIILPPGYKIKSYDPSDDSNILILLKNGEFEFTEKLLKEALKLCVPEGVHLIIHEQSNQIVSMMMARHISSDEFGFGGRIDWLTTALEHRGLGLGEIAAKLATKHLISLGYKNIWVTTQLFRMKALKIFLKIGFRPKRESLKENDWNLIQKLISFLN